MVVHLRVKLNRFLGVPTEGLVLVVQKPHGPTRGPCGCDWQEALLG